MVPVRPAFRLSTVLENCTVANDLGIKAIRLTANRLGEIYDFSEGKLVQSFPDHRQDSKGTWWMPWHQESMKGVNGCDKPR